MGCACQTKDIKEKVVEIMIKKPSKGTGALASEMGVSEMQIVRCLPESTDYSRADEEICRTQKQALTWKA